MPDALGGRPAWPACPNRAIPREISAQPYRTPGEFEKNGEPFRCRLGTRSNLSGECFSQQVPFVDPQSARPETGTAEARAVISAVRQRLRAALSRSLRRRRGRGRLPDSIHRHRATNSDGTLDWGYFQINTVHLKRPGLNLRDLLDCKTNIDFAYQLYTERGFDAWTAYTSGAYMEYLRTF